MISHTASSDGYPVAKCSQSLARDEDEETADGGVNDDNPHKTHDGAACQQTIDKVLLDLEVIGKGVLRVSKKRLNGVEHVLV